MPRAQAAHTSSRPTSDNPADPFIAGIDSTDVLHALLKLNNRLHQHFATHLEKRYNISVNEFRLLVSIGRLGTTASHELIERIGVNAMGISRAVSALHKHGRITVVTDPQNRRRKTLRLTPSGQRLYEQMRPATNKVARYLFEALRPDEIMAFQHFVKTLIERLDARDEQGHSLLLERTRPDD
jgi:MarR family transcriptional regulator, lower aerobic nicotinate degradation pathway regulator